MAAPAYAGSVAQPNFRQAPARSPRRQPAPSGPRTSPRRPPGTRPRDPRVIPQRPAPRVPAAPSRPVGPRPPPDYNPRPLVPPVERPGAPPVADPFRPRVPLKELPIGVALDLGLKAFEAWQFTSIFIDPDQIFAKPGSFQGFVIDWNGERHEVGLSCGSGPIGTGWGRGGAGGLCGTPLQVPGSALDFDGQTPDTGRMAYFSFVNFQNYTIWDCEGTYLYRGPFSLDRERYSINWEWGPFPRFVDRSGVIPSPIADPVVTPVNKPSISFQPEAKPDLAITMKPLTWYVLGSQWEPQSSARKAPLSWPWLDRIESDAVSYGETRRNSPLQPNVPLLPPYEVPQLGSVTITATAINAVAGGGHQKRPPRSDERERKFRMGNSALRIVMGVLSGLTEAGDLIDAIYKSIPAKGTARRWKGRDGKWREAAITPQDKLAFIMFNWDKIDLGDALWNIAENELEDRAFGTLGNLLKNTYQGNHDAGYKPNNYRGFQSGPAL